MNKPPDFLTKGFVMPAPSWCETEQTITRHDLEIVSHDGHHISYWKTCHVCRDAHSKLSKLGVTGEDPKKADRMPTAEWVFLVLHPDCVEV